MPDINDFYKGAPTFIMNQGPQDWCFYDDFNDLNLSTTAQLAKWTHVTTDAGNTALLSITKTGGNLVLAYSTPTDEDVIHLAANSGIIGNDLKPGMPIRFGCRFQLADVSHNDLHIGLSIHDTSIAASEPADIIAFRVVAADADGQLDLLVQKDSVEQVSSGIVTLADATWCRAFFEFYPTVGNEDSGTLYYEVHTNGTKAKGTMAISNCFPDDVFIAPVIQVQIEGTDSDVGYVDWIYAHAIRDDYTEGTG